MLRSSVDYGSYQLAVKLGLNSGMRELVSTRLVPDALGALKRMSRELSQIQA